jgi:hypothetical protein
MAACRCQAHSPCTRQAHFLFPSQPRSAGPWRSTPHGFRRHVGRCWKPRFVRPWRSAPTWLPLTCGLTSAVASSCPTPTTRALRRAHRDRAHTRGRHEAHLNAFQDNINLAFLLGEQGGASYHTSPRLGGGWPRGDGLSDICPLTDVSRPRRHFLWTKFFGLAKILGK